MIKTLGRMPDKMPKGMGFRVRFPVLARMDVETGDHRLLDSAGSNSRELPLSIRGQFAATYGHDGALVTGALHEITFDDETGIVSGRGFLLDDENGKKHALYIATGAMRGNSVDLAEVKARFEEDLDGDEWSYRIRFTEWSIGATTGVGTPAFADARAELEDDGEILASFAGPSGDELVAEVDEFHVTVMAPPPVAEEIPAEILASGVVQSYELFFHPEPDVPQKILVDANGHVYGHLGLWDSCHDGIEGQCVRIPRPNDSYASFNKPGVLTDRGIVNTGPIFAYGGHRSAKGRPDLNEAYGGIENAWADVRIVEGRLGPWISGVVRPGVDDTTVYAARASRISGHWVGGKLKAIVSVNAEGYDVPGNDQDFADLAAGFAFWMNADTGVAEMVASFPSCVASAEPPAIDPAPEAGTADEVDTELQADESATEAIVFTDVTDDLLLALLLEEDDEDAIA